MGDAPEFANEQWPKEKFNLGLDFPNIPYLMEGDYKITETTAIHRYIAERWNPELLGRDAQHRGLVNMVGNVVHDAKFPLTLPGYGGNLPKLEEEIAKRIPPIVAFMRGKFLTGDAPVWADFYLFEIIESLTMYTKGRIFQDYPQLVAFHHNVANLAGLKEYLSNPDSLDKVRSFNNK